MRKWSVFQAVGSLPSKSFQQLPNRTGLRGWIGFLQHRPEHVTWTSMSAGVSVGSQCHQMGHSWDYLASEIGRGCGTSGLSSVKLLGRSGLENAEIWRFCLFVCFVFFLAASCLGLSIKGNIQTFLSPRRWRQGSSSRGTWEGLYPRPTLCWCWTQKSSGLSELSFLIYKMGTESMLSGCCCGD